MSKIVLITGASSGIGFSTAKELILKGNTVYCAARRTQLMDELKAIGGHPIFLDLTDKSSIINCVNQIIREQETIDVLINNAGYGEGGALEDVSVDEAEKQFQVNVFGLMRITQAVLPYMRKNHSGRIINISSIAGRFSTPFLGWYHAAKYSVEALSDALRMETRSFGIKVSLIEPGFVKTNWGLIAKKSIDKNSESGAYSENASRVSEFYRKIYENSSSRIKKPEVITKSILKAVSARHPKSRYHTGSNPYCFILLKRFTTDGIFDFLTRTIFRIK